MLKMNGFIMTAKAEIAMQALGYAASKFVKQYQGTAEKCAPW